MIWYLIFMLTGAMSVALGIRIGMQLFEADTAERESESAPRQAETHDDMSLRLRRQWENLLNYDGTEQGDDLDEN